MTGPDLTEEPPESELLEIVEKIEHDEDNLEVPPEFLEEPEQPRKSLSAEIAMLNVGQRLKLALKGNREARSILMRDPNRVVRRFVLQNPRITEDEVAMICKNRSIDLELLDIVAKKRDWMQNYPIRLALVMNPKTPLTVGLRLVRTLQEKDVRNLAKSRDVPSSISSAAKRKLFEEKKQ